jgi:putative redox protein
MLSKIIWKGNFCFEGETESGHSVIMDSLVKSYGQSKGPSPMEIVALALGGCTGMDIVHILKKRKVELRDFQINIISERKEENPRVFSKIEVEYLVGGEGIREEDVALAVNLSKDKYCSVGKMLDKTAEIKYKWKIVTDKLS